MWNSLDKTEGVTGAEHKHNNPHVLSGNKDMNARWL